MPKKLNGWLKNSWAEAFRQEVLPAIPETAFAHLYHKDKGAPNFPVAILVALSIIKELLRLTDTQLIDAFHFNLKVLHALGLAPGERTLSPRTLYYFRDRVVGSPAIRRTFEAITGGFMETLALRLGKQRIDSTQVSSNMANLSRLRLFVVTIERFLHQLRKVLPERLESVPASVRERYLDRAGYFADTTGPKSRRRLERAARDLALLVDQFRDDREVRALEPYAQLVRVFEEQCTVVPIAGEAVSVPKPLEPLEANPPSNASARAADPPSEAQAEPAPPTETDPKGTSPAPADTVAVPKDPKEIPATSLQNPSDPDATYNKHKGKGHQVQLAETCHEDNPIQLITHVDVQGAHESDQHSTLPYIDTTQALGWGPDVVFGDTNYNSGTNLIEAAERGVDLVSPTPGTVDPDDLTLINFEIDWATCEVIRCPEGHAPRRQRPIRNRQGMNVHFDPALCEACECADSCPAGKPGKNRTSRGRLRFDLEDLAIAGCRAREETPEFKEAYKIRSGMEATVHELKTGHDLDRVWTRGKDRVTFAVIMKVLACNVKRFARHWCAQGAKDPSPSRAQEGACSLCLLARRTKGALGAAWDVVSSFTRRVDSLSPVALAA